MENNSCNRMEDILNIKETDKKKEILSALECNARPYCSNVSCRLKLERCFNNRMLIFMVKFVRKLRWGKRIQ